MSNSNAKIQARLARAYEESLSRKDRRKRLTRHSARKLVKLKKKQQSTTGSENPNRKDALVSSVATLQAVSNEELAAADLAACHAIDGPLKVAGIIVEHFIATGEIHWEALDRLKLEVDDYRDVTALLSEQGLPEAMMRQARVLLDRGDDSAAQQLFEKVRRVFGPRCAHRLDDEHGVSAGLAAAGLPV